MAAARPRLAADRVDEPAEGQAVMTWLRALIARLWPAPMSAAAVAVPVGQSTELCEAEWRAEVEATRAQSYAAGLAYGELIGRQALASELEAQFGPDGPQDMTLETAKRVRARQVH